MGMDPASMAVNAAVMGLSMAITASTVTEGPRLDDLSVTTADYGTAFNYFLGLKRFNGISANWAEPLREVKRRRKTKGGKFNDYTYYGTAAYKICDHPTQKILRVWLDKHLVFDATGAGPLSPFGEITQYMRFYLGDVDAEPDPRMMATIDARDGPGSTPAFRNVTGIVLEELPLEKLGNRLPQISVELVTVGADAFPYETKAVVGPGQPNALYGWGWSPDKRRFIFGAGVTGDVRYSIWDTATRTNTIHGVFDGTPNGLTKNVGISNAGALYMLAEGGFDLLVYSADGVGPPIVYATFAEACKMVQVLIAGEGVEYIMGVPSLSSVAQYTTTDIALVLSVDAAVATGVPFYINQYFADAYGDIWAVGATFALFTGTDDLCLWRVIDTSGRGGTTFKHLTGLNVATPNGFVCGFHAAGSNQYVLWRSGDILYALDEDTLDLVITQTGVAAENLPQAFIGLNAGATSFYLVDSAGGTVREWSSATLQEIRALTLADWKVEDGSGTLFDPINHALISAPQFGAVITWRFLDRAVGDGTTLGAIVAYVAEWSGLDPGDYDVSALIQPVRGYSWIQGTGRQIVDPLLEVFDSFAGSHDFQLLFRRHGVAPGAEIPTRLMRAGRSGPRYTTKELGESDLPRRIFVNFADPGMDQQPNSVPAQRNRQAVDTDRDTSIDVSTLVMLPEEARAAADGYLRRKWYRAESYDLALLRYYMTLEVGDVRPLELDDLTRTAQLMDLEVGADGIWRTTWERDRPDIHEVSELAGAEADGYVPSAIPVFGLSRGFVIDIPLVRDVDDGLIAYVGAAPYAPEGSWPGATVLESVDGVDYGDSFSVVPSDQRMVWGYAMSTLPDAPTTIWDRGSVLTIKMMSGGELNSVTDAQAAAGEFALLVGSEIIYATTADLVSADTYEVSGLLRGRRGTEQHVASHVGGERVVLLNSELERQEMGASDVGVTAYYKTVTTGVFVDSGFSESVTFTGASAKPVSPVHFEGVRDDATGDWLFTWHRRTRIGGRHFRPGVEISLGETTESYDLVIMDGAVERRVINVGSEEATWTSADQTTDFGAPVATVDAMVAQRSNIVGRGFATAGTFS